MNRTFELVRAVRGPLVLIVLGVLFAFDQADLLGFHRSWPILFIFYGVLKLIERLVAPQVAPQYYPPAPASTGPWQPPTAGGQA